MDDNTNNNNKQPNKAKSIVLELLLYIALLFVCIYIVPNYVIQRTIVDGYSMTNTLQDGENLLVNKLEYRISKPNRLDIVVLYPFGHDVPNEYYVKRIIGLPGETIQIIDSKVYINGKILEEPYIKENNINDAGCAANPVILADDEYFVMGDNRNGSGDSRDFGPVKFQDIDGHAVLRIYPFESFGLLTNK